VTFEPGRVRLRGVSRSFKLLHERNLTLKETLVRRRRTRHTEYWAVRDLDLDIAPGEAVGIIGQNGAGKSTLLKLVAGIMPPHGGTVEVGGNVACMLELGAGFHPDFTGRENVYLNGSIHGLSEREIDGRLDQIVEFSELGAFIDMPVRTYSSGMYMRLAFAIASHVEPDVLLLDEVLAVGDEAFQRKCMGRIFDFRRRGGTLLFVSHDPSAVERVCDRAILLTDGCVVADGPPVEVLQIYHRRLADDGVHDETPAPSATAPQDGEEADPRVWGTREVVIRACRLVGPDGPTDRILSGDPLSIEMDIEATREMETPNVGIAIHSAEGALLYGTSTRLDAFPIPRLRGAARIRFEVSRLALHEGRFAVTFAVSSPDERRVYHWLDRWLELTVFQRTTGVGAVDLSGSWSMDLLDVAAVSETHADDAQVIGST
jgi:ABC-type polysaccharide/polyol phosphate transport system ATPase subunit